MRTLGLRILVDSPIHRLSACRKHKKEMRDRFGPRLRLMRNPLDLDAGLTVWKPSFLIEVRLPPSLNNT